MRKLIALGPCVSTLLFAVACQAHAGDVIFVPLRWCAVEGSPAVVNPGSVGEPDTDNVLWRRHERVTDKVYFANGLEISFRSAMTADVFERASFPVIPDPRPPTNLTLQRSRAVPSRDRKVSGCSFRIR